MRKRFLSLLCVLALCLGLLPVTALAAGEDAPGTLWVGRTQFTAKGYWKTTTEGNFETGSENDYNVYYDGNGTLTLNGATIQGGTSTGSVPYGAGIYAQCSNGQSVTLTIKLIGENTITGYYGIYVNAEISADSNGTDASLTITGENNGSLEVSGSNHGIFVKSGTGNASLNIEKATVTSSTDGEYAAGVNVQSSANATGSPNISLSVNGGSLTASGTGNSDGILFHVGQSQATGATTSLTITDHAIVDARNGGISASRISETLPTPTPTGNNSSGIVFDDKNGTVYGNVTLDESLTINQGETLTVPDGSSLNCNGNLTNNGTIIVEKGGNLTGDPGGTVISAPTIGTQPASQTVTKGNTATFSVAATGEKLSYQWQRSTDNGQSWTDISEAKAATYNTAATTTSMNGYQYRCVVSNSAGCVTSDAATLTVNAATVSVTGVSLNKNTLELYTGKSETLIATVEPSDATNPAVNWSSDKPEVATVDNGVVTAVGEGEATITATAADSSGKFATCTVTVTKSTYIISADTKALDFGSAYTGYTQPAAQMVTVKNTGNRQVAVTLPTANDFIITAGTGFTNGSAAIEPDGTATFTVQPKAGLAVGTYSENITISDSGHVTLSIPATFTVEQRDNTPYYTITVKDADNGTVTCYAKSAAKGAEVTLTVKADVGYALDKLTVTDASGKTVDVEKVNNTTYTFVMPGSKVTVEAAFAPTTVEPSGLPFTDVSTSDWFYSAVKFVYENGLMDGGGNNLFVPNATLNRAMAVTILYRLEGSPDLDGENLGYPFADVDGDTWYSDAVYWARLNGIVDGVENNRFNPTGSLTREQMATILYRYTQYKGADVSASGDLSGFVDSANVSSWAADAVKWAVGSGLVNGVEGNALAPQGTSTRAQAATVLMRFVG